MYLFNRIFIIIRMKITFSEIINYQMLKESPTPENLQSMSINLEKYANLYLLKGNLLKGKEIYCLTLIRR